MTDTSFFLEFCDPHMWKKKGSSKWALLKHVTRTNSIGTCSSELYIFSLLKLPPPPRAAILVWGSYTREKRNVVVDIWGKALSQMKELDLNPGKEVREDLSHEDWDDKPEPVEWASPHGSASFQLISDEEQAGGLPTESQSGGSEPPSIPQQVEPSS